GTILFDLARRTWSEELLEALDLDRSLFPETFEGPQVTGTLSEAAAEETGLRPGTPVVAGGGDQSANAVGVGAIEPGIVALSLGTSGVVFAATEEPFTQAEGRLHAFCHAVPDRWHLMGVMLSAAGSCAGCVTPSLPTNRSTSWWPGPPRWSRARRASCSSPTCRENGRRIPTRTPGGPSSASPSATTCGT